MQKKKIYLFLLFSFWIFLLIPFFNFQHKKDKNPPSPSFPFSSFLSINDIFIWEKKLTSIKPPRNKKYFEDLLLNNPEYINAYYDAGIWFIGTIKNPRIELIDNQQQFFITFTGLFGLTNSYRLTSQGGFLPSNIVFKKKLKEAKIPIFIPSPYERSKKTLEFINNLDELNALPGIYNFIFAGRFNGDNIHFSDGAPNGKMPLTGDSLEIMGSSLWHWTYDTCHIDNNKCSKNMNPISYFLKTERKHIEQLTYKNLKLHTKAKSYFKNMIDEPSATLPKKFKETGREWYAMPSNAQQEKKEEFKDSWRLYSWDYYYQTNNTEFNKKFGSYNWEFSSATSRKWDTPEYEKTALFQWLEADYFTHYKWHVEGKPLKKNVTEKLFNQWTEITDENDKPIPDEKLPNRYIKDPNGKYNIVDTSELESLTISHDQFWAKYFEIRYYYDEYNHSYYITDYQFAEAKKDPEYRNFSYDGKIETKSSAENINTSSSTEHNYMIFLYDIPKSDKKNYEINQKWLYFEDDNKGYQQTLITLLKGDKNALVSFSAKWWKDDNEKYHLQLTSPPKISAHTFEYNKNIGWSDWIIKGFNDMVGHGTSEERRKRALEEAQASLDKLKYKEIMLWNQDSKNNKIISIEKGHYPKDKNPNEKIMYPASQEKQEENNNFGINQIQPFTHKDTRKPLTFTLEKNDYSDELIKLFLTETSFNLSVFDEFHFKGKWWKDNDDNKYHLQLLSKPVFKVDWKTKSKVMTNVLFQVILYLAVLFFVVWWMHHRMPGFIMKKFHGRKDEPKEPRRTNNNHAWYKGIF